MSVPPPDPALPGLEDAAPVPTPRRRRSPKTEKVRVGQTSILIYPRKSGTGWVFRYYLAGKSTVVERAKLSKAKEEALRIAVGIENGRAQSGSMSAGEADGYFHAMNQLGKLGAAAPSLGVALERIHHRQTAPAGRRVAGGSGARVSEAQPHGGRAAGARGRRDRAVPVGARATTREKSPSTCAVLRVRSARRSPRALPKSQARGLNQIESEEIRQLPAHA